MIRRHIRRAKGLRSSGGKFSGGTTGYRDRWPRASTNCIRRIIGLSNYPFCRPCPRAVNLPNNRWWGHPSKKELIDSRGFTYNVKERGKETTFWQCTMRPNYCRATVKERNGQIMRGKQPHNHPPLLVPLPPFTQLLMVNAFVRSGAPCICIDVVPQKEGLQERELSNILM